MNIFLQRFLREVCTMKSFSLYTLIIIVLLTACSKKRDFKNTQSSTVINVDESKATVYDFTDNQLTDTEVKELESLIFPMEVETPEINYTDMEQDLLSVYTEPIKNDYKFWGRLSNDGYCYILGISKQEEPVLKDLDYRLDNSTGYIQLGHWIVEGESFEKIFDLSKVRSFWKSKDGRLLYLGIKQYSDLDDIKYSDLGEVFDAIVNKDRLEYINQLHEKHFRAIKPFGTPYIAMYKWKYGEEFYAYKPISHDELNVIINDKTTVSPEIIDGQDIHLHNDEEEAIPFIPMNQSLYKMVKDFYEVRSLNEITDISSIKRIRKNPEKWQSRILNIEDADTVNEIVKVLKSSEVYYLGATSYEDLLILTKKDGSEIELQIPPYYPELFTGEGFILGDAVYYSPGREEWLELMDKFFNK